MNLLESSKFYGDYSMLKEEVLYQMYSEEVTYTTLYEDFLEYSTLHN